MMKKLMKKKAGFTLVELVVVIAILAILAGVAVPVYSGYIKKADAAADYQLLAAVNDAFTAACIENGMSNVGVTGAKIELDTDGTVKLGTVGPETIRDAFGRYYEGNEATAFKVFTALKYDAANGVFVVAEGDTYSYGGGTITVNGADVENLKDSAYAQMGMASLMGKIDTLSTFMSASGLNLGSLDYYKVMAQSMGIDIPEEADEDQLEEKLEALVFAKMDSMAEELAEAKCKEDSTLDKADVKNELLLSIVSNSAVLYTAKTTIDDPNTAKGVLTTLGDEDAFGTLCATAKNKPEEFASQMALAYAMYTAYAVRYPDKVTSTEPSGIIEALQAENSDFTNYVNGDAGKADLEGYLSALNMVSGSMDDAGAVETLLANGFSDPELVALLQQIMDESNP